MHAQLIIGRPFDSALLIKVLYYRDCVFNSRCRGFPSSSSSSGACSILQLQCILMSLCFYTMFGNVCASSSSARMGLVTGTVFATSPPGLVTCDCSCAQLRQLYLAFWQLVEGCHTWNWMRLPGRCCLLCRA